MRGLVARVANHQPFGARRELAHEVVVDALLHEDARARGATVAIQRKNGEQGGIQRTLHVGIVEDQDGRLAAQFHRVLLDAAGASQDLLARDGAARERDRAHAGVPYQRVACRRLPAPAGPGTATQSDPVQRA
ncbi:hypothetical protein G6F50_017031 [Rhizopus delemar]|uniref:Uncharacterized protein n=1 Tax=Rhizopus delemar TaxID=936053 RepID=A0A9P6XR65_9FUNG|nr:hypothetical protein G6F50_017031 [Rhizopus delemar]